MWCMVFVDDDVVYGEVYGVCGLWCGGVWCGGAWCGAWCGGAWCGAWCGGDMVEW